MSAGLGYKLSEHIKVLGNVGLVSLGRFEFAKPVVSLGLSHTF